VITNEGEQIKNTNYSGANVLLMHKVFMGGNSKLKKLPPYFKIIGAVMEAGRRMQLCRQTPRLHYNVQAFIKLQ